MHVSRRVCFASIGTITMRDTTFAPSRFVNVTVAPGPVRPARCSTLRTAVKKVRKAIAAGDKASAIKEYQASQAVIDRIADKKIVHKNSASRTKSRLAHAIKALA